MSQTIVVALGGNALQKEGEASAEAQQQVATATAGKLADLVADGHRLVIVHGNGPQVGNIILHEEAINTDKTPSMPLDTCGAMSQGQIGYWLQKALGDELRRREIATPVVTLVSQMLVDEHDVAFDNPSKPIGPFYASEDEARAIADERGFVVKEDAGRGWRRVVPSPKPKELIEADALNTLLGSGAVVITAGGGGIPVVQRGAGLSGIEAVIDKDFSAAVVAKTIGADQLIILTAVDAVSINFNTPDETPLREVTTDELQQHIDDKQFAPGSMLPKVQAASLFVAQSGNVAKIGSLDTVSEVIRGENGTIISQ